MAAIKFHLEFISPPFLRYAKTRQPLSSLSPPQLGVSNTKQLSYGCASQLAYFKALQIGKAYQVAPIDKPSIALIVIIAVIFLGECPSLRGWLALALIGGSVMMLAFK